MRQVTWYLSLFLFCVVATSMVGAQEAIIISEAAIDPVQQGMLTSDDVYGPEIAHHAERQKRKLLEPVVQASFGIKSSLLNLIFGKVNQLIDYKTRLVSELDKKNVALNKQYGLYANKQPCDDHTTVRPGRTTTEDVAEFDSRRVSLDVPGEVFGSSFRLLTDISKIVNDVILNTADRTQRFVEAVKPMIARVFGIKSGRRTFSKSNSSSSSSSRSTSSSSSSRFYRNSAQISNSVESIDSSSKSIEDLGS